MKSEIRNLKSERSSKLKLRGISLLQKLVPLRRELPFEALDFRISSDFRFRISDF
jgi:hypothetical protein